MEIITGKIARPLKICVYGPEGVGKTTFASKFPKPIFIDTEDSTVSMDVARLPKPSSWTMLLSQVDYVKKNSSICETLVIDTADWAERLCAEHICAKAGVDGIEGFNYGKGYTYLEEEFGRFLNKLQEIIEIGINVVVTAHAEIKKIEQPEEIGGFDHWQLKLEKKTMQLVKEWCDMLLFANYKVFVVNVDNQGAAKGKNKAQGGSRIMHTTHHPCWDAKNRADLPEELKFEFSEIAHLFKTKSAPAQPKAAEPTPVHTATIMEQKPKREEPKEQPKEPPRDDFFNIPVNPNLPKALIDLMTEAGVSEPEIQVAVASKGYYPAATPIDKYDQAFINGVLIGAWPQVMKLIIDLRKEDLPF